MRKHKIHLKQLVEGFEESTKVLWFFLPTEIARRVGELTDETPRVAAVSGGADQVEEVTKNSPSSNLGKSILNSH